ncbi:MAG: beta-lactamase family protein [Gammaproteobacteria bacterium]|nr:beta-lactamase family protein [Gammaproteobacteria bacterium]MDH4256868.1 beta-lactamase family protein [Gammaproteobacteria bacterium]
MRTTTRASSIIWRCLAAFISVLLTLGVAAAAGHPAAEASADDYAGTDRLFEDFHLAAHIPGLVYGVVADGRLVHVRTYGVQDLGEQRPVTPDSLFRIASMTKAFTALTVLGLRDEGGLRLDAPAADYVPELRKWQYPTADSAPIRVRDLLNHVGGLVTDDPWGDRQTSLPEDEFTALLEHGVNFTRAPGMAYEYSNLGYALLGRIITNVSGTPYADTIEARLLRPLGMASSGFDIGKSPQERRALGYRWEENELRPEPPLAHGAFGAMGGMQTSANDYAKWVAFLLSAWPPRDGEDAGPVRRATVRELAQGSNFPRIGRRYAPNGTEGSLQALNYGMGLQVRIDSDLGFTLSHSGGYPGYGSHMLLLPDRGIGIFAFANRTYKAPTVPVWQAALLLERAGLLGMGHAVPVSDALAVGYRAAGAIYAAADVNVAADLLAMNFLMDRDAALRARDIRAVREQAGDCDTSVPIAATGALSGTFAWRCEHGRVSGSLLLAPTRPSGIQELVLEAVNP